MAFNQLEVNDFSGGLTDYYLDSNIKRFQRADNFILTTNLKPKTRPGSTVFDSTHYAVLSGGNPRIGAVINYDKDNKLFAQINRNIFFTTGIWSALNGPVTFNPVFSAGDSTNYINYSEWNKHLMLVNDAFAIPMKVYVDQNGDLQVRNAGLQLLELTGAIQLANQIKTKFNAHIADAVGEHILADTVHATTSDDTYSLQTLITLVSELLIDYAAHRLDATLVIPIYHVATSAANALTSTSPPRTLTECLTVLDDLKTKFNAHDNDGTAHGATGNYQAAIVRTPTFTPTAGAGTYLYKLHYHFNYQVNTVAFEDFGPTSDFSVASSAAPNVSAINITNIPTLSNGAGNNYDTVNIKIFIYRTINAGSIYYKVAEITNGTTSYSDTMSDATLIFNETVYTTGGIVDNDQPLPAKYIHVVNGFTYYANVLEGSQILKNRVLQSINNDPDSVPNDFFLDFEDEITGMSSVISRLIVFTKKWGYRVEGFFDELGRGGPNAERIGEASGCISSLSLVQTNNGLFYAGTDGFYYTDGYNVQKISSLFNDTYKLFTNTETKRKRIVGTYEEQNQRIYWAVQLNDSSQDNDTLFVLDLRQGIKPDSCFMTWSNEDSFAPSSVTFFNKELVRADKRGFLFKHQETLYSDLKVEAAKSPAVWNNKTIIWDYKSASIDFGSSQVRKFVNRLIFQAKNQTNVSIQINSINDDGRNIKFLKEIRFRSNIVWGDPDVVWGDPDIVWGYTTTIEAMRRFPAGGLRCSYKQIQITNAYTVVTNSDVKGNVAIDATLKTATLLGAFKIWPTDSVDYYLSFAADNYVNQYLVTARTSDSVLTFQDSTSLAVTSASSQFLLKGYLKGESLHLVKYVMEFSGLTDSQEPYAGGTYLGTNA